MASPDLLRPDRLRQLADFLDTVAETHPDEGIEQDAKTFAAEVEATLVELER